MEKKEFLDALNLVRTGSGSFSFAYHITGSVDAILEKFPEFTGIIVSDLSVEICSYAVKGDSDSVMVAEQSLYAMEKTINFTGDVALIRKFLSVLEELSQVEMVYNGTATGIIAKFILEKTEEYEKLLVEYPLRYNDVRANLFSKYDWLEDFLEKC